MARSTWKRKTPSDWESITTMGKIVCMKFGGNHICLGRMSRLRAKLLMHQFERELGLLGKEPLARVGRRNNGLMHGTRTYNNPFLTMRRGWPGATPADVVPPLLPVLLTAWRRSVRESRPDYGKVALRRRMLWALQPAMTRGRRQLKSQKCTTTSGRTSRTTPPSNTRRRTSSAARRAAVPQTGVTQPTLRPALLNTE